MIFPVSARQFLASACLGSFAAVFWSSLFANSCHAESWTDLRGTRTIEARMVGMWGDSVFLETSGGRRISVKLASLRSESRIQAREIARRMKKQLSQQVTELNEQRMTAAAPAPKPLPKPRPVPAYQAPKKDAEIADFLANVDESITDGHLIALYDSLPPKYRADIDEVVKLAVANIDNESFAKMTSTLQQFGDVLVKKQNWLVSSPRIASALPSSIEVVEGPLVSLADTMRVVLIHPTCTLENLQDKPFGQWLREVDSVLAPHLADIQSQSGVLTTRAINVEESDKETATVKISVGEKEATQDFAMVDGYWVPEAYARDWDKMIADLKKQYASNAGPGLLEKYVPMVEQLSALIGPLQSADDAGDFHGALETTIEPLLDFITPMLAISKVSSSRRRSSSRSSGALNDQQTRMMKEMERAEAAERAQFENR